MRVPAARRGTPPRRPVRLLAIALGAMAAVAACSGVGATGVPSSAASASPTAASASASAGPASPAASPSASASPTLLIEVRFEGGFINPSSTIGQLPVVVVDTAGRFYLPDSGAQGSSIIPKVDVRDTGPAGAAAVLDAARKAGLADGSVAGGPGNPDAGAAVVTLVVDGREVVTRVTGPGGPRPGGPGGPGVPGGSLVPGATDGGSAGPQGGASDLIAQLTDPSLWGAGSTAPTTVLRPTAYRLWVAPAVSGSTVAPAAPWPLAADPASFGSPAAATFGVDGLRSGVVDGAEATTLATALATVPAGAALSFGGHAYQVWVRPLLPTDLAG